MDNPTEDSVEGVQIHIRLVNWMCPWAERGWACFRKKMCARQSCAQKLDQRQFLLWAWSQMIQKKWFAFENKIKIISTYSTPLRALSVLPWWRFYFQIWHLRVLTCKILVAFLFSNLTLKGVNLQKFGGVFFFKFVT